MRLDELLRKAGLGGGVVPSVPVSGLSYDSRAVTPGHLFFAIKGAKVDGHDFLSDVATRGAVAAVTEKKVSVPGLLTIEAPSIAPAMAAVADHFFGHPSGRIPVIGVTGTNGKTTTTYLIEDIYRGLGLVCGVMGTISYRIGPEAEPAPNTTPMSIDVQRFIDRAIHRDAAAVAMEVSSHALELHRVDGVEFASAVFTNLTQDHLDFHGDMEAYYAAKAKLFQRAGGRHAINIGDPYGRRLLEEVGGLSYGFDVAADVRATDVECDLAGLRFVMTFRSGRSYSIRTNLMGFHNVENLLAAAAGAHAAGLSEDNVVRGLNRDHSVPGRLQRVEAGQDFVVVVDYAHTHDALEKVLLTLRRTNPKRLSCVFGAGGDRDRTKRPKMGRVASMLSDKIYITSDNPRTEDPQRILGEVAEGAVMTGRQNHQVISDRREAIFAAVREAKPGDILLIAGKGHEDYQIVGTHKIHFSDVEVAREAIESL